MTKKRETLRLRMALSALALTIGLAALTGSGRSGPITLARAQTPAPASASAATECAGEACTQVSFTFDEAKGQYLARNNSTERWVRVSASNFASSASACLAPGKEQYLSLKSVVGPYGADYAEPKCGEAMD